MTERTEWTDPALNREFTRLYKQINGTPEKMIRLEEAVKTVGAQVQNLVRENAELHKEWREANEAQPWTRGQRIALFAVVASVLVGIASMLATILTVAG